MHFLEERQARDDLAKSWSQNIENTLEVEATLNAESEQIRGISARLEKSIEEQDGFTSFKKALEEALSTCEEQTRML